MTIEGFCNVADARELIVGLYRSKNVNIPSESELWYLLEEMRKFTAGIKNISAGKTPSETDDLAMVVGFNLLRGCRLSESLQPLSNANVPHITQTLRTLASFKHCIAQHRLQFDESEYELYMASQFVGLGPRVSFIDTKRPSRFKQRVEFMLGYKWPVECKHPRSERGILVNIDAALKKLNERSQAGIICIGLEVALPMKTAPYLEVMKAADVVQVVSQHVEPWLTKHREMLSERLMQSYGRFIIFTYTISNYIHEDQHVGLPSLRLALSATGWWIDKDAIKTCLDSLTRERTIRSDSQ